MIEETKHGLTDSKRGRTPYINIFIRIKNMSLLVTAGLLIVAIILLIVTFVFATDALWQLGISNLFKTIEEVFDGKNKGETATDYLIYAMIISGTLLGIFVLLIVVAIILVIVGGVALGAGAATGVDEGALAVAGVAEGGEAAAAAGEAAVEAGEAAEAGGEAAASEGPSFLSKIGNLLNSWVGTVLMIVLVIVIFTSSASGACTKTTSTSPLRPSTVWKPSAGFVRTIASPRQIVGPWSRSERPASFFDFHISLPAGSRQ